MKKILLLVLLCTSIATQSSAAGTSLFKDIVVQRDFFTSLVGFENYSLLDIENIKSNESNNHLGVIFLSPSELEESYVFDLKTKLSIYSKGRIMDKETREFYKSIAIPMSDVKKLVRAAIAREAELRRGGWIVQEGTPGKDVIIPPSPVPQSTTKKSYDNILSQVRKSIKTDSVSELSTEEILRKFRADIQKQQSILDVA